MTDSQGLTRGGLTDTVETIFLVFLQFGIYKMHYLSDSIYMYGDEMRME